MPAFPLLFLRIKYIDGIYDLVRISTRSPWLGRGNKDNDDNSNDGDDDEEVRGKFIMKLT
jgi:hypothetical protein